jgi:hypothetical protein
LPEKNLLTAFPCNNLRREAKTISIPASKTNPFFYHFFWWIDGAAGGGGFVVLESPAPSRQLILRFPILLAFSIFAVTMLDDV